MAVKEFLIEGKKVAVEILEQHPSYFKFKINILLPKTSASPMGDGSTSSPRARLPNDARPAVPAEATSGEGWEPVEGYELQTGSNDKIFEITLEKYDAVDQTLNLIINNQPVKIKYSKQPNLGHDDLLLYIINNCSQILCETVFVEPVKHKFDQATAQSKVELASAVHTSDSKIIKSPLAGRIIKILVSVGDHITKNQPLVIIESMKMENEIRATFDGIIKNISIEHGNLVQQNQVLITFE